MAFKLTKTNNFKTAVNVVTPTDGKDQKWSFTAEFKIIGKDEAEPQVDFLDQALVSVEGVPADDSITQDELLTLVKSRPDTRNALLSAYTKAVVKKNQTSSLF
ncbi:MAG TPA: hypothetical protein DEG76_02470 [Pseudohongiella sp.]|nr:hypothetical protein [Pseudohongiella sp.]HBX36219.1 hypothetical protein [Pseudohongiella sp.]